MKILSKDDIKEYFNIMKKELGEADVRRLEKLENLPLHDNYWNLEEVLKIKP